MASTITNKATIGGVDTDYATINVQDFDLIRYKTVDGQSEIPGYAGMVVTWKMGAINNADYTALEIPFEDILDLKLEYIEGSFKINGEPYEDIIVGRLIRYTHPSLEAGEEVTLEFQTTVLS